MVRRLWCHVSVGLCGGIAVYVYFIYAHTFVYICVHVYCIFKYKWCGITNKYLWGDMLISILLEAGFSSRFKVGYGWRVITAQVHLPSICSG